MPRSPNVSRGSQQSRHSKDGVAAAGDGLRQRPSNPRFEAAAAAGQGTGAKCVRIQDGSRASASTAAGPYPGRPGAGTISDSSLAGTSYDVASRGSDEEAPTTQRTEVEDAGAAPLAQQRPTPPANLPGSSAPARTGWSGWPGRPLQ